MGETKGNSDLIWIGQEIRAKREARGWGLKELHEATGISVSHLSQIERGNVGVRMERVFRIGDVLGIHWGELFDRRPQRGRQVPQEETLPSPRSTGAGRVLLECVPLLSLPHQPRLRVHVCRDADENVWESLDVPMSGPWAVNTPTGLLPATGY
jgi:transcriptional regulator with XRE-family HTH domain